MFPPGARTGPRAILDLSTRGEFKLNAHKSRITQVPRTSDPFYQRIRAELTARGARFRSKSDSELILHLFPRLGMAGMLPVLRGEFAFALYDRAEECLYLVRDRFGIKPFFYTRQGHTLYFASEIKTLLPEFFL